MIFLIILFIGCFLFMLFIHICFFSLLYLGLKCLLICVNSIKKIAKNGLCNSNEGSNVRNHKSLDFYFFSSSFNFNKMPRKQRQSNLLPRPLTVLYLYMMCQQGTFPNISFSLSLTQEIQYPSRKHVTYPLYHFIFLEHGQNVFSLSTLWINISDELFLCLLEDWNVKYIETSL